MLPGFFEVVELPGAQVTHKYIRDDHQTKRLVFASTSAW